jgi:ribulose-5-phosphate 4-epimerase/fuculose-1-phosphate aldolase
VLHVHSLNGIAVSAQKGGVLPISQQSIFVLSGLSYHDYEGVALRDDEKPRLVADLGPENNFLMLRNHGLLTLGPTIPMRSWACTCSRPSARSRFARRRAAAS